MGGFTSVLLKDGSDKNITEQNKKLRVLGIPRKYKFYNLKKEQKIEYSFFKKGEGSFLDHLFPKDKIKTLEDFKKYWNTESLGEAFCPQNGMLTFDCYFNRTPDDVMFAIGTYIAENIDQIKEVEGSFSTFIERGMTEKQREIVKNSDIEEL